MTKKLFYVSLFFLFKHYYYYYKKKHKKLIYHIFEISRRKKQRKQLITFKKNDMHKKTDTSYSFLNIFSAHECIVYSLICVLCFLFIYYYSIVSFRKEKKIQPKQNGKKTIVHLLLFNCVNTIHYFSPILILNEFFTQTYLTQIM